MSTVAHSTLVGSSIHVAGPFTRVRAVAVANGTLATAFENGDTLDGLTLATGDRILLAGQTSGAENGIRVVAASGAPARATDFDTAGDMQRGLPIFVQEGTVNAGTLWVHTTAGAITVGTTALVFAQVGAPAEGAEQHLVATLTHADLLALDVTPPELVPAPGAGTMLVFRRALVITDAQGGAYTVPAGQRVSVGYDASTFVSAGLPDWDALLGDTGGPYFSDLGLLVSDPGSGPLAVGAWYTATASAENKPLVLAQSTNGGAITGGDAANTVKVHVWFSTVTL